MSLRYHGSNDKTGRKLIGIGLSVDEINNLILQGEDRFYFYGEELACPGYDIEIIIADHKETLIAKLKAQYGPEIEKILKEDKPS